MNIDKESAAERDATTYTIYLQLHAAQKIYPAKTLRTVISELLYADPFAWRAVGITKAALDTYRKAGKNRPKEIERAHLTDRSKMVEHILKRDNPMTQEELFSYWRNNDRVVIALKSENRSNRLGDWIPFDNDDAKYFARLGIGFRYKNSIEGELIERLSAEIMAGERHFTRAATRSSWKTMPLPSQRELIQISIFFTNSDFEKIRLGYIPKEMEDKWFIFFEDGWLYFYRSWSGFCVYGARLDETPTGALLSNAWVNTDKKQYSSSAPEYEVRFIESLITGLLLS